MFSIDKLLDWRYIYIMKDLSKRGEYKIGITSSLYHRTKQVDESVRGRVVTVVAYRRFFAENIEKKMHRIFARRRFTKHGSGRTEWFKLNILQYFFARLVLWYLCNVWYIVVLLCIAFGVYLYG
jgi:hypothetical protein